MKDNQAVEPLIAPLSASRRLDTRLFAFMLLSSLMCLVASLVLSVDAFTLALDPTASLSCDFNSVISCGKVALSSQAQLLGFPNSYFGLMAEPVILVIAVAGLSGVRFPKWMMVTTQAIYLLGLVFALWLFYQSAFVIQAFCPWCLIVTVGTTVTFFTLLRYNILHNNFSFPEKFNENLRKGLTLKVDYGFAAMIVFVILFIIFNNYGSALFL